MKILQGCKRDVNLVVRAERTDDPEQFLYEFEEYGSFRCLFLQFPGDLEYCLLRLGRRGRDGLPVRDFSDFMAGRLPQLRAEVLAALEHETPDAVYPTLLGRPVYVATPRRGPYAIYCFGLGHRSAREKIRAIEEQGLEKYYAGVLPGLRRQA